MNEPVATAERARPRVLIVDDDPSHVEAIRRAFRSEERRFEVLVARSLAECLRVAAEYPPEIALIDLNLPDGRALDLLAAPGTAAPAFPVLVMTSHGDERTAVETLKAGALDYVVKSPEAFAQMPRTVQRALRELQLVAERRAAERELRDRERELAAIYENAPITMLLIDEQLRVAKVNHLGGEDGAEALAGLIGSRPGEALHCLNALDEPRGCGRGPRCGECPLRRIVRETLKNGIPRRHVEITLPLAGGGREAPTVFLTSAARLEVQGRSLVLVSLVDITERRHAEQAVVRLNARLEERVAERTAQLESAVRELETFAYSVSHDLRAPLRAIEGFSAILAEEYGGGLDEEGRRLIGVVRSSARRMDALISDLLSLSRVTRDELHRERVDMGRLAAEVFAQTASAQERAAVAFAAEGLPEAWADPGLVRQVFTNLLANALKFTRGSPQRRIVVEGRRDGERTIYTVRDNGVGFEPAYRDKLFGAFERLHLPEQFEGTGIGLAIVERIVRRHGGEVGAEGVPGAGAAFTFSLPAPPAGPPPAGAGQPTRRGHEG